MILRLKEPYLTSLVIIGLICLFINCSGPEEKNREKEKVDYRISSILHAEERVIAPFVDGKRMNEKLLEKKLLNAEKLHPLHIGSATLYLLRASTSDSTLIPLSREYLQFIMDSLPLIKHESFDIYPYNFSHGKLKSGWWSGMANSVLGMALYAGYERFGEEIYFNRAKRAMKGVVVPVEKGGSAISFKGGGKWFSEYVWPEVDSTDCKFVLNGFLYSLLSLYIVGEIMDEEVFLKNYTQGLKGLQSKNNEFYFRDSIATFYSTNPLTIESVHYQIFDNLIYESLKLVTNDQFYAQELKKRRRIFYRNYGPSFLKNEKGQKYMLFSAIGPPHPYWIDIYNLEIDSARQKATYELAKEKEGKNFMLIPFSGKAYEFELYSRKNNTRVLLYRSKINRLNSFGYSHSANLKFDLSCRYDARKESNNKFRIIPLVQSKPENKRHFSNNQGKVDISLSNPINFQENKYLGLIIKPEKSISSFKIVITGGEDKKSDRYYISLKGNQNNLVLLNWLGFIKKPIDFKEVEDISLVFYTSKQKESFSIEINQMFLLENNIALFDLFKESEFHFPEK